MINDIYKGKQFILNPGYIWVIDEPIFKWNREDRYIITEQDYEYWPMTLIGCYHMFDNKTKNTSYRIDFKHANEVRSHCEDVEFKSIRIFTPSRLNLIKD